MTSSMKKNDNYLDHVFRRSPEVDWDEVTEEDKDDTYLPLVVLHIRHRGLSHFIAEKFFNPRQQIIKPLCCIRIFPQNKNFGPG